MARTNKKIISLEVRDEYILGSGVSIGAVGSFDSVVLKAKFNESWDALHIYATWTNALGEVGEDYPQVLSSLCLNEEERTYEINVPAFATQHAGTVRLSFTGYQIGEDGSEIDEVLNTASGLFKVLESNAVRLDHNVVSPTVQEQLHADANHLYGMYGDLKRALATMSAIWSEVANSEINIETENISQKDRLQNILDYLYPVGAIYITLNNDSPASKFGGNWVPITGRFLLGAGKTTEDSDVTYKVQDEDGEPDVVLTSKQLPVHSHPVWITGETYRVYKQQDPSLPKLGVHFAAKNRSLDKVGLDLADKAATGEHVIATIYANYYGNAVNTYPEANNDEKTDHNRIIARDKNDTTERGEKHNNMPPYLVVYMWRRIP